MDGGLIEQVLALNRIDRIWRVFWGSGGGVRESGRQMEMIALSEFSRRPYRRYLYAGRPLCVNFAFGVLNLEPTFLAFSFLPFFPIYFPFLKISHLFTLSFPSFLLNFLAYSTPENFQNKCNKKKSKDIHRETIGESVSGKCLKKNLRQGIHY